jgi:hypothetical protein
LFCFLGGRVSQSWPSLVAIRVPCRKGYPPREPSRGQGLDIDVACQVMYAIAPYFTRDEANSVGRSCRARAHRQSRASTLPNGRPRLPSSGKSYALFPAPSLQIVVDDIRPSSSLRARKSSKMQPVLAQNLIWATGGAVRRGLFCVRNIGAWRTEMAKKTTKLRPWTKEDIRTLKTLAREKVKTSVQNSFMKNRKRETCTSGTVRDEDGNILIYSAIVAAGSGATPVRAWPGAAGRDP